MTKGGKQLEDILLELMTLDELGDDQIVAAVEAHPEHRTAILSFYEDWLTADDGRGLPETTEPDYVPDISALWAAPSQPANPFEDKSPIALKGIAQKCGISLSILSLIEERGIRAASIPLLLVRNLATETRTTIANMLAYLDQDQAMLASDFRSDKAPVLRKVSFADAVRSSSLSDEAKDNWLKLSE
ncbi:hypothetical protein B5K08_05430 [Rhizobium leguminosarum bv. trifolii]|uniref:Uncharacterized protein n=1 Tax=Rhizobium leguminosarum bv. trifolii TaxID=386 RepID=A0A3E1BXC6_RHILT|nr:hypothetical protein [Rhizobium leguminosarum]RFB97991.1 hypothetical protein B5K08_05430 [Rhizobium leguminosarum bv. trifolii]RFB99944.1 hypothetical protein B5K10_05420 [Rhizobium leguminosarum bv. trifolii]